MKYTKQIRQLLQERGAENWERDFVANASKSRVSSLKDLTEPEAVSLISLLTDYTHESLINAVYHIACQLGAITELQRGFINDLKIIEYAIMVFSIEQSKPLLNITILNQLNYLQMMSFSIDFANIYQQHLATQN